MNVLTEGPSASEDFHTLYRLPAWDIDGLLGFCQRVQDLSQKSLKNSFRRLLLIRAVDLYDWRDYHCEPASRPAAAEVFDEIRDRIQRAEKGGRADPEVTFRFEVDFFLGSNCTLAEIKTLRDEFIEIWEGQPEVQRVARTDETHLPGADNRLTFAFTSDSDLDLGEVQSDLLKVPQLLPSFELRVERLARRLAEREKSAQFRLESRADYMRFQEWLHGDEGEDFLYNLKKRLKPRLRHDLHMTDIFGTKPG